MRLNKNEDLRTDDRRPLPTASTTLAKSLANRASSGWGAGRGQEPSRNDEGPAEMSGAPTGGLIRANKLLRLPRIADTVERSAFPVDLLTELVASA